MERFIHQENIRRYAAACMTEGLALPQLKVLDVAKARSCFDAGAR
jgi:hypothetical protein